MLISLIEWWCCVKGKAEWLLPNIEICIRL